MQQTVRREDRLMIRLNLVFPDVNMNKSYPDANRNHLLLIDGVEEEVKLDSKGFGQFRLRSKITVIKRYGRGLGRIDSTFTYRVGENFAELNVPNRKKVRVEVNFEEGNYLKVLDDSAARFKIIS